MNTEHADETLVLLALRYPQIGDEDQLYLQALAQQSVAVSVFELSDNALCDQLLISPRAATLRGSLGELIAGSELSSSPTDPSEVDIAVCVHGIKLLTQHCQAGAICSTSTSLSQDGLPAVGPEPVTKSLEGIGVVGRAGGVGTAVV